MVPLSAGALAPVSGFEALPESMGVDVASAAPALASWVTWAPESAAFILLLPGGGVLLVFGDELQAARPKANISKTGEFGTARSMNRSILLLVANTTRYLTLVYSPYWRCLESGSKFRV